MAEECMIRSCFSRMPRYRDTDVLHRQKSGDQVIGIFQEHVRTLVVLQSEAKELERDRGQCSLPGLSVRIFTLADAWLSRVCESLPRFVYQQGKPRVGMEG